jgi:hypothetical protein
MRFRSRDTRTERWTAPLRPKAGLNGPPATFKNRGCTHPWNPTLSQSARKDGAPGGKSRDEKRMVFQPEPQAPVRTVGVRICGIPPFRRVREKMGTRACAQAVILLNCE